MPAGCGEMRERGIKVALGRCLVSTTRWTVMLVTEMETSRKITGVGENQEPWFDHVMFEMPISYPTGDVK